MFSGKNIGFDQTSPRLHYNQVFYGHSLKFDVPGPGQYQSAQVQSLAKTALPKNMVRAKKLARPGTFQQPRSKTMKNNCLAVFDSQEQRFKPKGQTSYVHQGGTSTNVGPGSYQRIDNTMIKKSFNLTMEHSYFM